MTNIVRAWLFAAIAAFSSQAFAAPCGGFTDVDDTTFNPETCQSAEWLKNRSITLGCTSTTLFCPNQPVLRSQMALFMRRLATALEPTVLYQQQQMLAGTSFATILPSCVVGPIAVTGHLRGATVSGWALLHPSNAGHLIGAGAIFSVDGGVNWFEVGGANFFAAANTSPGEFRSVPVTSGSQPIAAGQSILFAIGIGMFAGAGFSQANTDCAITVRIDNRNSTSSPFDPTGRAPVVGANLH